MNKIRCYILLLVSAFMISNADEVSLLMVPNEAEAVKIGLDVASHHPSLLLIKYQLGAHNTARLFGWKGTEWIMISNSNYLNGKFFKVAPRKTLIVESKYMFPESLIPSKEWCPNVYKISNAPTASLIHLLGVNLDFDNDDWKSFSNLYNLSLSKINPNYLGVKWYHRRLNDVLKSSDMINKKDESYLNIIREEDLPSLVDYISDKEEDEIINDIIIEEVNIDVNPLQEEAPEAIIN